MLGLHVTEFLLISRYFDYLLGGCPTHDAASAGGAEKHVSKSTESIKNAPESHLKTHTSTQRMTHSHRGRLP
jgi:hypothetical protein